ncbi:MAG: peptidoglycan DD-metalloendopeptidase family protein [Gammaproteobacteria bacterium]|nr:peptidoglycan DD-metalloendopeptidase family protein [Gammaproteobacteria bacterium]
MPRLGAEHLRWFLVGIGISIAILALQALSNTRSQVQEPMAGALPSAFQLTGIPLELPGTPARNLLITQAQVTEAPPAPGETGHPVTLTVRPGDSMDSLFGRNNLDRGDLAEILKLEEARSVMRLVHPGDTIQIRQLDGKILRLNRRIDETHELEVTLSDSGNYQSRIIDHPLETRVVYAHGTIKNSLFLAGRKAGISDKVTMNLAGIFAWDVDFVLDIRENDEFVLLYEELWQDGSRVKDGEILAAEFVNRGETLRAIRYTDSEGHSDYFSPEGNSMRKAFIRAPVDFTRISSNFNPNRKHPILNKIRAHKGVDYAAPNGTPIKAAGDGKVIFAGRKNGYGNCVILQHGGNITTLYAHMSRFSKEGRVGRRVVQGQIVGYVGATGLATAPHLHYEYRVNGVHRNPRTVKLPQANPVAAKYRKDFLAEADAMMSQLDMVRQTRLAAVASD